MSRHGESMAETGFVLDKGKGKFVKNLETCDGDECCDIEVGIGFVNNFR